MDHDEIFHNKTSKIKQWKKLRKIYGTTLEEEQYDDYADHEKEQWFNHPKITLYLRNELQPSPRDMKKFTDLFINAVPGNYYNLTHREVNHQDVFCPTDGTRKKAHDLFANPNATSYYALLTPSPEKFAKA